MTDSTDQPSEQAHDVLAAEEFGMPAPDPALHEAAEDAHDVLAAEEFGMGSADPSLHHGPLQLPDDPSGIAEPHDVLAAEEFGVPAGRPPAPVMASADRAGGRAGVAAALGLGTAVAIWLRKRFRTGTRRS